MTSLRFVGDVPLWAGLTLATLVAIFSWRYYQRERSELSVVMRCVLPLLRSSAFFLGIMLLTGPVLQHRTVIGELGRVRIYLDGSGSMTMRDVHMSTGRKLLIAEQLEWLPAGRIDADLLIHADALAHARRAFGKQVNAALHSGRDAGSESIEEASSAEAIDASAIQEARDAWLQRLSQIQLKLPEALAEQLTAGLLQPLEQVPKINEATAESTVPLLTDLAAASESLEVLIRNAFDESMDQVVASGDPAIRNALSRFDETPRWRRAEMGLMETSSGLLQRLREKHYVEVFILNGDKAVRSQAVEGVFTAVETATESDAAGLFGPVTDLATGIAASQKGIFAADTNTDRETPPQTALILMSDGQHNAGVSPLQTARILGSQGTAVYTLATGADQQAPDLAVTGLEYPDSVFQKDGVRGVMIVCDRMSAGQPFVAQIAYEGEVLWQKQLVTQTNDDRRVEFEFSIDELVDRLGREFQAGIQHHNLPLAFTASIAPLPGESELTNNQRTMRLAAITQSFHVLILDGRSRWETRYLRNVFARDDQWHVDTVIAGPGTDAVALPRGDGDNMFPETRDKLFEYDLVIFGELSRELLSEHEFQWLREFVEIRGGGIVFIDGQRGRLQEISEFELSSLLPVEWLANSVDGRPTSMELTDQGAGVAALQLSVDDQQNRRFWTELPAPHRMVAVNALPGSEVLVEALVGDTRRPAIVTRTYGAGRILYMAFDESWRWRYKVADTYHQRIWNQLATFVMPQPFAVSDDYVSVDTGTVSYGFGDSVDIRVRLTGLDGKPAVNATADALVWRDGRVVSTVSLNADPEVPGIYRSTTGALDAGAYEVSVRAAGYSESVLKARSRFTVSPPESGEMEQTASNTALLKNMAEASGGVFLREEQLSQLPDLLNPLSSGRVVETQTELWQTYWWFAAIVLLLSVEWMLRKRSGLL